MTNQSYNQEVAGTGATHRSVRAGFSLIEAVCCIVLLSVGVPGLMWAMAQVHDTRAMVATAAKARFLAEERLEDVMADRHSTTRGYTYVVSANYPAEATVSGFAGLSRTTTITETGASLSGTGTGFKTVTVTVSWTQRGAARSFVLSTLVTDYTP